MTKYYKTIDSNILYELYKLEDALLEEVKKAFLNTYSEIFHKYNLHSKIYLIRWIDDTTRNKNKEYDGYRSLIQIDILNSDNLIIEIDENIFSPFAQISNIDYISLGREYRVDYWDDLDELWDDIKEMIHLLEEFNGCWDTLHPSNSI